MPPRQQSLFDDAAEPWELDAGQMRRVAEVVFPTGPPGPFDYLVPKPLGDDAHAQRRAEPGRRVRVPFGRGDRSVIGYCVAVETKPLSGRRLKSLGGVVDARPLLSPSMLRLTRWIADYYLCPWGQVLEGVLPAGVRSFSGTRIATLLRVSPTAAAIVAESPLKSPQQQRALDLLAASSEPLTAAELARRARCTTAPIQALAKRGVFLTEKRRVDLVVADEPPPPRESSLELNDDQRAARDAILVALEARTPRGILLHGVTGSGKTEVYLQAIERVVSFGRQAIVLVPEISLTPQTVRRFRARFDRIAVLHSHLSDVDRHRQWQRIARGDVEVVVGARSAVFAPTPHLGLIVIDEEHETSFKQDTSPRYHARDVAWQRAQAEAIPLVLGSATPALETWQRAVSGEFLNLSLPKRVLNLPLPAAMTVDLKQHLTGPGGGVLSRPLVQAMKAALADGGQVMLLLNRRGYATHIQCPQCGFVLRCEHCDAALTFHRQQQRAICHLCDFHAEPPQRCPDCRADAIRYGGLGTQKLEAEVRARFPESRAARMDFDAMRKPGSHAAVLDAFHRGEIRILLGTQMIAKGLDFPNVTLVGVVNADTALYFPDFRAAERTFQLVAQVAGRTGRGRRGGRVIVQTLNPEHPAIAAAVRHDYQRFAAAELAQRRAAGYPPFSAMVRLVIRGPDESLARAAATDLGDRLRRRPEAGSLRILGPAAAPLARLRGDFRFHVQLHAVDRDQLHAAVAAVVREFSPPDPIRCTVDVDPWEML